MKILVLGGTRFLGRHFVAAALASGHELTLFNRGSSNPGLFPGIERIAGDRGSDDGGLDRLTGRHWDVVVDTCGYLPRVVRMSGERLRGRAERYVFVSTVSVYAGSSEHGMEESAPVIRLEDESTEDIQAHYGGLKALCERAVLDEWGEQALVVRPGLICGPHDPTGRFTWWVRRLAEARTPVLAPGAPGRHVQFIDARDLANWIVTMIERGRAGTFNAAGPTSPGAPLRMDAFLDAARGACARARGFDAGAVSFIWAPEKFLLDHEVTPWMQMPLWVETSSQGLLEVKSAAASREGLRFRPVETTIEDTLAWVDSDPARKKQDPGQDGTGGVGLTREREESLLAELSR